MSEPKAPYRFRSGRGGYRKGAGRLPPEGGRRKSYAFTANPTEHARIVENAAKAGYNNVSEFIRARTLPEQ